MADLTLEVARELAGSLVTIGHPYSQAALNATALDLIKWCKGAIRDGRIWTAEEQAEALVAEARAWDDGWPDKGGTKQLENLFLAKYAPPKPERKPIEVQQLVSRGLLAARCILCEPDAPFCEFGGARKHAREAEARVVDVTPPKPKRSAPELELAPPKRPAITAAHVQAKSLRPLRKEVATINPITAEDVHRAIENATANRQTEQRRKLEQLEALGIN